MFFEKEASCNVDALLDKMQYEDIYIKLSFQFSGSYRSRSRQEARSIRPLLQSAAISVRSWLSWRFSKIFRIAVNTPTWVKISELEFPSTLFVLFNEDLAALFTIQVHCCCAPRLLEVSQPRCHYAFTTA